MTRGSNRRDLPTSGSEWNDRSCPVETWEYWEGKEKFAKAFSLELRVEIVRALASFETRRTAFYDNAELRQDRRQRERSLRATVKRGTYPDPEFALWVELHSTHLSEASASEKAADLLREFLKAPHDFTMEIAKPEPLYTKVFHELFQRHDFHRLLGSTADRYLISPEARRVDPSETAFIEFVRRCIWKDDPTVTRSVDFCNRISKLIGRR